MKLVALSAMLLTERENQMTIEKFGLDPGGKLGLSNDDVVSLYQKWFRLEVTMVKLEEMMNSLAGWATVSQGGMRDIHPWFTEKGCQCQILRSKGGGWQKGRFRIRLEFIPDNPEAFLDNSLSEEKKPESPLDDLRSQLNPE